MVADKITASFGLERTPAGTMDIEELLRKTVDTKASDLHLTVGAPPMTRLHGEMVRLPYPRTHPPTPCA